MKTRGTTTKLIISIAALLLLGTSIVAFTQIESPSATRVPICVKDNGQLRLLTGNNTACGPSERQMDWVVGGEVTDVRVGPGLVGSREDGIVNLALDPSIFQTCAGCGRIFAGFDDGPGSIPRGNGDQFVPVSIAGLDLPAGNFAIFAKMTLRNVDNIDDQSHPVRCKLTTGIDFDEATVIVEDEQDRNGNGVPDRDGATSLVMSLMVVHHFDTPGGVTLLCADGTPPNDEFGTIGGDGDVKYEDLKIIAIEASDVSNVFLGGN